MSLITFGFAVAVKHETGMPVERPFFFRRLFMNSPMYIYSILKSCPHDEKQCASSITNREMLLDNSILSMVFDLSCSGAIYSRQAFPLLTLSSASARSTGDRSPFIYTASAIPFFSRFSTWSFISDWRGDITTVKALETSPSIKAGSWNVNDFPPPVGKTARSESPCMAAFTAFS